MPTKTVKVQVDVPEGTSQQARESAERQAHEAAVLALWETGALTIRQAAEEIGLPYHDFLDRLAAKGIPVERGALDLQALEEAQQKLAGSGSG